MPPLLDQYCVTVPQRSPEDRRPRRSKASRPSIGGDAETWEKVVRKVRAGLMPPAGAKRPERAALDAFAGSIETAIDRVAAANPNPGRRRCTA